MLADRLFNGLDRVAPPSVAYAHCDIPCGIYDPHTAQIAALTVTFFCKRPTEDQMVAAVRKGEMKEQARARPVNA